MHVFMQTSGYKYRDSVQEHFIFCIAYTSPEAQPTSSAVTRMQGLEQWINSFYNSLWYQMSLAFLKALLTKEV